MMITTILAILAVDFPIFPRRYAKVETWGTSLMDLGVGSFVFSAGVVSARSLHKDNGSGVRPNVAIRLLTAIRHSIPLIILGIIRLVSVKGLDYAEHVTEYGVHWNFFFTLAFLPPFVELADSLLKFLFRHPELKYSLLALALAVVYEVVLDNTRLLSYILISPRGPDLLSKNREGVFSFIGYLSIFLAGRGTGWMVVNLVDEPSLKMPSSSKSDSYKITARERNVTLWGVAIESVISTALYFLSTSVYTFNLTVSRRLANLPYVLWVIAFNNIQILLCGIIEAYGPEFSYNKADNSKLQSASSKVMQAFNQNGLAIFLVANLLTGLVNLTVNTLDMSGLAAMSILIAYAAAVTAFAMGLNYTGIKIKL
jgi:glucosaminylphosphatidylinositol acyltransferase